MEPMNARHVEKLNSYVLLCGCGRLLSGPIDVADFPRNTPETRPVTCLGRRLTVSLDVQLMGSAFVTEFI